MSTLTAENILQLIEQLPALEQNRLKELLAEPSPQTAPVKTKAPRDKRVPCEPMPDRTLEMEWVEAHKHEYPGQWVALEGDRLIAASPVQQEVLNAMTLGKTAQQVLLRIPSPDDLPYVGGLIIEKR